MDVKELHEPCCIYRSDFNQFIQYGGLSIIFNDSLQALDFVNDFPMFFSYDSEESPFKVVKAGPMVNDKQGTIWYDSIADKMEEEKKYWDDQMKNQEMKGVLKDG